MRAVYGGECVTVDSMELTTPDVNLSDAEESTVQSTTTQPVTFQTFIEYDENPEENCYMTISDTEPMNKAADEAFLLDHELFF